MVYLDYSATTPVNKDVLETFNRVCLEYVGNPNSLHFLGVKSKKLISDATEQIASILNVKPNEVIYTSGSSESNNLAIKGIAFKYQNRGKHIITTPLEHSSIYGPLNYLANKGFEIDFVKLDENGMIDLDNLKSLLRNDTILVSVASVNSEIGLLQPIEEIANIIKEYPKCFFHVDATQSIGKVNIPIENIDLLSFSAHKIYGLKGIGCLIKKEKINLEPIIHGGKSTTVYRSGTPATPLIISISKALRLEHINLEKKYKDVNEKNMYLKEHLKKYENIYINSNDFSIPYILNFSVVGIKPETMLHAFEEDDIYISTQSACSTGDISKPVFALTNDEKRAQSSLRVSISYYTTKEELDLFLKSFDKNYNNLMLK
ncbi:MAG: cysteine desulfurase [Clostridium sp.]|nr:cysteine desulfurase [Clostridium sp.]MCM1444710.1 cysteine desulfurase [Candidatus Amulumruptor caecigallinarius]